MQLHWSLLLHDLRHLIRSKEVTKLKLTFPFTAQWITTSNPAMTTVSLLVIILIAIPSYGLFSPKALTNPTVFGSKCILKFLKSWNQYFRRVPGAQSLRSAHSFASLTTQVHLGLLQSLILLKNFKNLIKFDELIDYAVLKLFKEQTKLVYGLPKVEKLEHIVQKVWKP